MRKAFVRELTKLMQKRKDIHLLTGDLGFGLFDQLQKDYPQNYLNTGLMEQTMVSISAGMALVGEQVFVYSHVPFLIYKAYEQIRNDICFHDLPVKLIGTAEGLTFSSLGMTHHSLEDIALMISLPNIYVVAPGDPEETAQAVKQSITLKHPLYLRLSKTGDNYVHREYNNQYGRIDFKFGKGIVLREGTDVSIIATGNMLETACKVAELLEEKNISSDLISMHTLKPIDELLIMKTAQKTCLTITLEEHYEQGGLGQKVTNIIHKARIDKQVIKFCLPDTFIHEVGKREYILQQYDLLPEQILKRLFTARQRLIY